MRIEQSIIIPAYNERHRIGTTLESIAAYGARMGAGNAGFEVIVVCDGCRDGTEKAAHAFAGRFPLRVVSYGSNRGKGYAVRRGMAVSLGRVVAFMDADGATPVDELGRLADPILRGRADIVVGSRRAAGATVAGRQPVLRRLLGRAFAWHTEAALGLRVRDTQCGFKVFDGDIARELFKGLSCDGFAFDLELLAEARECGLRVEEQGVEWHDVQGSTVRPLRDGVRMLRAAWQIRERLAVRRRARTESPALFPAVASGNLYNRTAP
jgi:dolichyl-phosphate beta-glucosyltransferase